MKLEEAYVRSCNRLCELIPQEKREKFIHPLLEYAGIAEDFDFFLGKRILISLLFGFIGLILPWTLSRYLNLIDYSNLSYVIMISIILGLAFSIIIALLYYLHLYYAIEDRAERVEVILPDFLLLVASNLRAGMTPFAAFRNSARSEFGPLADEVKVATAKSLGTESFSEALRQLSARINSRTLKEAVSFFAQSLRSGGHLAKLLETTAFDIRRTEELKRELSSSTRLYVIFVVFVVVVATPLLLAISVQFLDMINLIQQQNRLLGLGAGEFAFLSSKSTITAEFMQNVAFFLLFGNALLAGLFMGVLEKGKVPMGLRHSPILFVASIIIFFISRMVLSSILVVSA